ncbi:MAG: DMT family transporter [Neofamilia sp.]
MEKNRYNGTIQILFSTSLWGTALVYSRYIIEMGFPSKDVVSLKLLFGFIALLIYILIKNPLLLKIDKGGIFHALSLGIFCHALYNLFMFLTIDSTNIATAVALLYTSPIFVMIMSRIFFREKINGLKIFALILAVMGIYFTVTNGDSSNILISKKGLITGLASGFTFALSTIISKASVAKYRQETILMYTFLFAFIFSLLFSNPMEFLNRNYNPLVYFFIIMLGVLSTAISYLFYLNGLKLGVPSSKASIISTLEVPISVIGEVLIFKDELLFWKILGIVLIMISIFLINYENFRH